MASKTGFSPRENIGTVSKHVKTRLSQNLEPPNHPKSRPSHHFPFISPHLLLRAAGIFAHTPSQGPGVLAAARAGVLVEVLEEMIDGRHGGMSPAEGWNDPS